MKARRMAPFLRCYPNREVALLLELGFSEGFRIHSHFRVAFPIANNLRPSSLHPEVVTKKLFKEVSLGRMAGPFGSPSLPYLVVSSLGVVPKKGPNKFLLIHYLSYPRGGSVNDSSDPDLCTCLILFSIRLYRGCAGMVRIHCWQRLILRRLVCYLCILIVANC